MKDKLRIEIIKSDRKSIAIELKPGILTVRAPKGMSRREINAFLEAKMQYRKA